MQLVVLNSLFSETWLCFSEELIVNSDAVVGKGLAMAVIDALADLQELEVVLYSLFVLLDVVVEHSDGVVGAAFIAYFARSPAPKGQHFIVFQPHHDSYISGVVDLLVEPGRLILSRLVQY